MTCRDFQRKWDELLDEDARLAAVPDGAGMAPMVTAGRRAEESEAVLLAHAAGCPDCRPIAARYQVLRHAIRAWRQPPAPPADLVHRILSMPVEPTPGTREAAAQRARRAWHDHRSRIALVSGLAASVLVAALLGLTLHRISRDRIDRLAAPEQTARIDLHSVTGSEKTAHPSTALNRALAEATSATWDLARSASEPAARISRDMLDATTQGEAGPDQASRRASPTAPSGTMEGLAILTVPVPSLEPLAPDASAVLQQVGDRLSTGVEPLSSTARHAFGFLLGPPPDRNGSRTNGRTARGA